MKSIFFIFIIIFTSCHIDYIDNQLDKLIEGPIKNCTMSVDDLQEKTDYVFTTQKFESEQEFRQWFHDNITYKKTAGSKGIGEYWKLPDETYFQGGMCRDIALLFLHMYKESFGVTGELVPLLADTFKVGHVVVKIGKYYFDPMDPDHNGKSINLSDVISKKFKYSGEHIPYYKAIWMVYNYHKLIINFGDIKNCTNY